MPRACCLDGTLVKDALTRRLPYLRLISSPSPRYHSMAWFFLSLIDMYELLSLHVLSSAPVWYLVLQSPYIVTFSGPSLLLRTALFGVFAKRYTTVTHTLLWDYTDLPMNKNVFM